MKRFLSLPFIFVAVALLTACGGPDQVSSPKQLIPSGVNFIAQVQVARFLQDADINALYDQKPKGLGEPQSLDELLDMAQEETGIDFRQFKSAVLFGDVSKDDEYFGVIAQGVFNEAQLIAAIEENTEYNLNTMEYGGQQIYADQEDIESPALLFLDNDTLVLGALPAVQDVIDVQRGELEPASGRVYDTFNSLGEPLFSMALEVPPEAWQDWEESFGDDQSFGMMPAMDALRNLDVVALVVDKPGSDLKVEATLDFFTPESATEMADTLDGFLKLAGGFIPDEGVRTLLDKLQINVNGTRVTINFQAPVEEIQEVARSLEQDFGGQPQDFGGEY